MPKRLRILFLLSSILIFIPFSISSLKAAEKQVRVIAEKAAIYAENNIYSYKIEIVRKGTILTVFETGEPMEEWFYVRYHSQRWKSVVTGFIQASLIEEVTDEPKEQPKEEKIEPKPKSGQIEQKPVELLKKPEVKKEEKKEEPPKISVEEVLVASSLLPQKLFTLPEIKEREIEPRVFMSLETRPPQKKITAPQKEQIAREVQPKIEKPESKPAKIKPEEEHFVEIESVGKTPVPPSTSYALPKVEAEKDSMVFMSIEALPVSPVSTESSQTQTKSEEPPQKKSQIATQEPPRPKRPKLPSELSLFTFNVGYGPSLGSGLGALVQLNTKTGFSLHLGAGYYPTSYYYSDYDWVKNKVLYSVGLKYYLPFKTNRIRTYLDLQYGGVSVEALQIVTSIWYYQYIYENIQKTLYGPSILAGIELKLGSIGLNGAIGLSYSTTQWDYWDRDYFLTADVGLLLYLW